jgi:putative acetyltransferase
MLLMPSTFFLIIAEMNYQIERVDKSEYKEIVDVWEASVRATHHFLKEEDILYYKPLILNEYLDAVELRCIKSSKGNIAGFLGVADHNLEMLFVHPEFRGNHIGKSLLRHSIDKLHVTKVDVNEQNEQADGFYHHCGFKTIGLSKLDASGKLYPLLHMTLK